MDLGNFLFLTLNLRMQVTHSRGLRDHKASLERAVKHLETRKLKLMEQIYTLQKQYEKQSKLNSDLPSPATKVEILHKPNDSPSIPFTTELLKSNLSAYRNNQMRSKSKFTSSLQKYKQKIRPSHGHKSMHTYKRMNTAEDLILSKHWKVKWVKKHGSEEKVRHTKNRHKDGRK